MGLVFSSALMVMEARVAHAEAPPQTDSDASTTVLDDFLEYDTIQLTSGSAGANVGRYQRSNGSQGLKVSLQAQKKLAGFDLSEYSFESKYLFPIHLGSAVDARLQKDGDKVSLQSLDIESPRLGLFAWNSHQSFREEGMGPLLSHGTARVDLLQLGYSRSQDAGVDKKIQGLEITPGHFDFHIARKAAGVPFEICGSIEVLKFTVGEAKVGENRDRGAALTPLDVMGCAAVSAGPMRLSNETRFESDIVLNGKDEGYNARVRSLSTDTHLDFVSNKKRKAGIYYSYDLDQVQNHGSRRLAEEVKSHTFGARVAF